MTRRAATARWLRRARPALGTLVDVGASAPDETLAFDAALAVGAAFTAIDEVRACLSRFDPASDIARFTAAPHGARIAVSPHTQRVLMAALRLQAATAGLFDITMGSAPCGWRFVGNELHKLDAAARIDLGGIGKGYAVDCAVRVLRGRGATSGWVNAGGDLRAFGRANVPLVVRDERRGGARPFATLQSGAFATSRFGPGCHDRATAAHAIAAHVSVAAPRCLWADALTKVVAISGDTSHPLLRHFGARAWLHA
jgi:thiamine biosynthesis lipoprotein